LAVVVAHPTQAIHIVLLLLRLQLALPLLLLLVGLRQLSVHVSAHVITVLIILSRKLCRQVARLAAPPPPPLPLAYLRRCRRRR
jgi:hypothetical protein